MADDKKDHGDKKHPGLLFEFRKKEFGKKIFASCYPFADFFRVVTESLSLLKDQDAYVPLSSSRMMIRFGFRLHVYMVSTSSVVSVSSGCGASVLRAYHGIFGLIFLATSVVLVACMHECLHELHRPPRRSKISNDFRLLGYLSAR